MLRAFDGFDHWTPGGLASSMVATEDSTQPSPEQALNTPVFWTGFNGTLSSATGREGSALKIDDPFGFIFMNLEFRKYWVVGVAIQQTVNYVGWASAVVRLRDSTSASDVACVAIDDNGILTIYSGDMETVLARSEELVVSGGEWYYIEFKVSSSDAGWFAEARVDGLLVARADGVANPFPNSGSCDQVMLCSNGGRVFDDYYLVDGNDQSFPTVTDYLGPVQVETWLPATDSEEGSFRWEAGSPPHVGTYLPSGFGLNGEPGTFPGPTPGDVFAGLVAVDLPVGDGSYIGSKFPERVTRFGGINQWLGQPLLFGLAPPDSGQSRVHAVSLFMVSRSDLGTPEVTLGLAGTTTLPPYYRSTVSGATFSPSGEWARNHAPIMLTDPDGEDWTRESLMNSRVSLRYFLDDAQYVGYVVIPTEIFVDASSEIVLTQFANKDGDIMVGAETDIVMTPEARYANPRVLLSAHNRIRVIQGGFSENKVEVTIEDTQDSSWDVPAGEVEFINTHPPLTWETTYLGSGTYITRGTKGKIKHESGTLTGLVFITTAYLSPD